MTTSPQPEEKLERLGIKNAKVKSVEVVKLAPQEQWMDIEQEYRQAIIELRPQEWWLEKFWPRVQSYVTTQIEAVREGIREYALDERDKAKKVYAKDRNDDYSQGYFMAMNTIVKFIDRLTNHN